MSLSVGLGRTINKEQSMAKSMWDIIARANGKKTGDELVADRAKKERAELDAVMNQHNLNAAQAKAYLKMQRKMAREEHA